MVDGRGLLKQILLICLYEIILILCKFTSYINSNHIHNWQVSPQLSSQIWMRYLVVNRCVNNSYENVKNNAVNWLCGPHSLSLSNAFLSLLVEITVNDIDSIDYNPGCTG